MATQLNLRELNSSEVLWVSGGLSFAGTRNLATGNSEYYQSPYQSWASCFYGSFGGLFGNFVSWLTGEDCQEEIVVTGQIPDGVNLGNGHELVTFSDGVRSLYVNGEWFANVKLENVVITNGSTNVGVTLSKDSGGFTYSSGESSVYSFKILPGR